ncbi:MAG: hypothetical protein MRY83_03200 [Flavobacteriales bacterium]|nr:hypothetical protein [Flavobacteriales bacterium]
MKKKQKNIILIIVALVVWGYLVFVIYDKFFRTVDDSFYVENDQDPFNTVSKEKQDTYRLHLNYRDPFLSRNFTQNITKTPIKKEVVEEKWPQILYVGSIKNDDASEEIAIVKILDVEHFWTINNKIGDLKLLKINKEEIIVLRGKEKRTFSKQ